MELEYNFLNILVLFGALQGFILTGFLYKKRKNHRLTVDFFLLFLFSLAFFNLIYAALDMNLFRYHRPLHMFPFPYKWLIGIGFYFYIRNQFIPKKGNVYHRRYWFLFIPAIAYFFLRLYWFVIAVQENSFRITAVVMESNFFRIHEFIVLLFTLFLLGDSLWFLHKKRELFSGAPKVLEYITWLKRMTLVFSFITALSLFLYALDIIIHEGQETFEFLYPQLLMQMLFIYWIGFLGFTQSSRFFKRIKSVQDSEMANDIELEIHLQKVMERDEMFKNSSLTVHLLASHLKVSAKELSKHINERHGMNFSEYLNTHRLACVKDLLASAEAEKYTLVSLAEIAGFSSKSTFNSIFKKYTGLTPSAYKKQLKEN